MESECSANLTVEERRKWVLETDGCTICLKPEYRAFLNPMPSTERAKTGTNQFGEIMIEIQPVEATCKMERCLEEGKIHHRLICKEMERQPELVDEQEIPYFGEIFEEAEI